MFVIPCKYNSDNPIIFECIDRIKTHHPDDKILVVDSASEDRSYITKIKGADVALIENKNYSLAAYSYAYNTYRHEQYFYCIHDSLLVNSSMKQFEQQPLTVLRYFCSPPTGMGLDDKNEDLNIWANAQLQEHVGISVPDYYYGIFGPIFFAQRDVMDQLSTMGFFNIKCLIKHHMSAMERMLGITLCHLGYNLSALSLQGEMIDFFGDYDSTYAQKVHLLRS